MKFANDILENAESLLDNIEKNRFYLLIEKCKKNKKKCYKKHKNWLKNEFLPALDTFFFTHYFPMVRKLAEIAGYVEVDFEWKNIVKWRKNLTLEEFQQLKKEKKVLLAIYTPKEYYNIRKRTEYLVLLYNSQAPDGRKATVSYHYGKSLEEVIKAELVYKKPFTAIDALIMTFGLFSIFFNIIQDQVIQFLEFLGSDTSTLATLNITTFFGSLAFLWIIIRLLQLFFGKFIGMHSQMKLITRHKKRMKGRLDSNYTFFPLLRTYRQFHAKRAKIIVLLLMQQKMTENELFTHLKEQGYKVTPQWLENFVKQLKFRNILLEKDSRLEVHPKLFQLAKEGNLDDFLYESMDLPQAIYLLIRNTYAQYLKLEEMIKQELSPKLLSELQ